ncbi:MAG: hypothetical protein Q9227_003842 [Pyrenula ochraceoflavens]
MVDQPYNSRLLRRSRDRDDYFGNPIDESTIAARGPNSAEQEERRGIQGFQSHRVELLGNRSPYTSPPSNSTPSPIRQASQHYHLPALASFALNDGSTDLSDVLHEYVGERNPDDQRRDLETSLASRANKKAQKLPKTVKIISPPYKKSKASMKGAPVVRSTPARSAKSDFETLDDIPMTTFDHGKTDKNFQEEESDEDEGLTMSGPRFDSISSTSKVPQTPIPNDEYMAEASRMVRAYTGQLDVHLKPEKAELKTDIAPEPIQYKASIASQLKKLHEHMSETLKSVRSATSIGGLSSRANSLKRNTSFGRGRDHFRSVSAASSRAPSPSDDEGRIQKPSLKKAWSSGFLDFKEMLLPKKKQTDHHVIQIDLRDTIARQDFIITLCRVFIETGVPTHRLEEVMKDASDTLLIRADFMFIPGCMLVSFDDPDNGQSSVRLVKASQGIDLGKLKEAHDIYQLVRKEDLPADEGAKELKKILEARPLFNSWIIVLLYGAASAFVGPFAFNARLVDLPISFVFGLTVGVWAEIIAKRFPIWASVYEVLSAVLTSLLARTIGSIKNNQGAAVFCFSAIAQSSIALILPGFTILCGVLELLNYNMTAGSVRMVYAIIKALLLGFGITVGTAIIGKWHGATSDVTCAPTYSWWTTYTWAIRPLFVFFFTLCLMFINQVNFKQREQCVAMVAIAMIGYEVTYWSSVGIGDVQVANAIGAFVIGLLTCFYTTIWKGMAAAAILPAIFVQVPSGLAASGSLVSGITSANQISGDAVGSKTGSTVVTNGTEGFAAAQNASLAEGSVGGTSNKAMVYTGTISNIGIGMVQVALGISGGLFVSVAVFYTFFRFRGTKRGLFTF